MGWGGAAILGVLGLMLVISPQLFFRSDGDAGRDARMSRGLHQAGVTFLLLAALAALLKLVSGQ